MVFLSSQGFSTKINLIGEPGPKTVESNETGRQMGLIPPWHVSEELGLLCWIQAQDISQNSKNCQCQRRLAAKVFPLGFDLFDIDIAQSRPG